VGGKTGLVAERNGNRWVEPAEGAPGPVPFQGRWPAAGTMRAGRVYAAAAGSAGGGGALLPTPRASDGTKGSPNQHGSSGDLMLSSAVARLPPAPGGALLPTPRASERGSVNRTGARTSPEAAAKRGWALGEALNLLPTPSAADGKGGHTSRSGDRKGEPLLGGIGTLLPTPNASDWKGSGQAIGRTRDGRPRTAGDADRPEAVSLLPTPTANVSGRTGEQHMAMRRSIGRTTPSQLEAAAQLLPTPQAHDAQSPKTPEQAQAMRDRGPRRAGGGPPGVSNLNETAANELAGAERWGRYAAAVERWERALGVPPPPPTEPGKTAPRLSPAFSEWMMGVPGWVTGVPGLSRAARLRVIGNGVCPQQGALALSRLLAAAGEGAAPARAS
jgi:DNA (cytosine-5)-methyltransferase 1